MKDLLVDKIARMVVPQANASILTSISFTTGLA